VGSGVVGRRWRGHHGFRVGPSAHLLGVAAGSTSHDRVLDLGRRAVRRRVVDRGGGRVVDPHDVGRVVPEDDGLAVVPHGDGDVVGVADEPHDTCAAADVEVVVHDRGDGDAVGERRGTGEGQVRDGVVRRLPDRGVDHLLRKAADRGGGRGDLRGVVAGRLRVGCHRRSLGVRRGSRPG